SPDPTDVSSANIMAPAMRPLSFWLICESGLCTHFFPMALSPPWMSGIAAYNGHLPIFDGKIPRHFTQLTI
ncbi:MAG TPA: hypothetical protein VK558_14645, partial [Patescibacteria group bacterium]|nr:hypothetical protein [Patescibacteria group bacterium]